MKKQILILFVICILLVPAIGLYQCTKGISEWQESLEPQREPSSYLEHHAEWKEWGEKYIEHFPKSINEDKQPFYYLFQRGFLQGGSTFHLGIKLTDEEFERVKRMSVEPVFHQKKEDYPVATLYPLDEKGNHIDWTRDYTYRYIGAENTSGLDYWNHGYVYGIAFSKHESKIIYFAEVW